jgi:hypothetical protein
VVFKTNNANTAYTMYWYEWGSGALTGPLDSLSFSPGTYRVRWTNLGGGKALFLHPKVGATTVSTVDLVAASSSGISRTPVYETSDFNTFIFGAATPKVPGFSAYTPYGPNKFVLIDSSYVVTEPFATNSTSDYDSGVWNNIGDGYNGVAQVGSKFILVQRPSSGSSIDLYYDDGSIAVVGPMLPNSLIGAAGGDSTLWVTDRDGVVYTISVPQENPNLAGVAAGSAKRFSNPRWGR